MTISASQVAELRAKTGAGMLDCKKALDETNGDIEKAIDLLRKNGTAKAAKRAGKIAAEGKVISYIHGDGKIGVLLELNCETDFVARTEQFGELAKDIAMHIAAMSPKYVSREEVSTEEVDREMDIYREQLKAEGKPEEIVEKILTGKIDKYYSEICLLEQAYIKDEDKTITKLLEEKTAEIGEKLTLRRFTRYELGEGIEKKKTDYLAEIAEQLGE